MVESRARIILAIFGGMVTTTGAILLFQNTFDLFTSWALVTPTSIGLAMLVYGSVRGQGDQVKSGLKMIGVGLAIFIFGAVFFELSIGISGFQFGEAWLCWPGLLIGLGAVLLLYSLLPRRNHHSGNHEGESQGE